jgi:transketolase
LIAENGLNRRFLRVGLRDTYAHGGAQAYLMRHYRLDARAVVDAVSQLIGESIEIDDQEIASIVIEPVHGAHKAEAL